MEGIWQGPGVPGVKAGEAEALATLHPAAWGQAVGGDLGTI